MLILLLTLLKSSDIKEPPRQQACFLSEGLLAYKQELSLCMPATNTYISKLITVTHLQVTLADSLQSVLKDLTRTSTPYSRLR